jgi:molybdopterin-guanine dinucleotide biosynthesis protein A
MGSDKALLRLQPGGRSVIQRLLDATSSLSDDRFVVAPPRPGYRDLGCRLVAERVLGAGPLSGIEAALRAARYDRCLILACDLPLLSAPLLCWLAELPCERDALVPNAPDPARAGEYRVQPLAAIYARRCLPVVSALLDTGERRLSSLLERLDVCFVAPETLASIDPDGQSFLNLNTPNDLERARRRG